MSGEEAGMTARSRNRTGRETGTLEKPHSHEKGTQSLLKT